MERHELETMRAKVATMRGEWAEGFAIILQYFPQNADTVRVERLRRVFAALCRIHGVS